MFRHYLNTIIRNIVRSKIYSMINIAGLAIGLALCFLIMLWVQNEFSYDDFHLKENQIYRVCQNAEYGEYKIKTPIMMFSAGPEIAKEYPEVISSARIMRIGRPDIKYDNKIFDGRAAMMADNSVFSIFTFPMIAGDPKTALEAPNTIVITEDIARDLFDDDNPIGKTLTIINVGDFAVTGVIENVPQNSHLKFDMLLSLETHFASNPEDMNSWEKMGLYTYLLLKENTDYKTLEAKFPSLIQKHLGARLKEFNGKTELFLQPLTDVYLYSDLQHEPSKKGNINFVYLMISLALTVLIIAGINFVNLTTAHSSARAKEVGMKKILGASKKNLINQYVGESIFFAYISTILALIIVELALPAFNAIMEKQLDLNLLDKPSTILFLLGIASLVGLVAGYYPALVLSSFRPIRIFRPFSSAGDRKFNLRNILTVLQFSLSIIFITGSFIIYQQLQYVKNKNLGFNDDCLVVLSGTDESIRKSLDPFIEELANISGVISVSASSIVPGTSINIGKYFPEGISDDKGRKMHFIETDCNFIPTMGMELVSGRNFSDKLTSDNNSVIINETAVKEFGWDNALGKTINQNIQTENGEKLLTRNVIGVVKDYHQTSLYNKIEPQLIGNKVDQRRSVIVKIDDKNISATLDLIKNKWERLAPEQPFNFYFQDEAFDSQYRSDEKLGKIISDFTILAIFVACLGLFGISVHSARRRTKEIGVRKVLGASVISIMRIFTGEFFVIMLIASIIAWPIAYLLINNWLSNFAYRIDVGWLTFALSTLIAMTIGLITISYQAIKAARSNPVETLRYE